MYPKYEVTSLIRTSYYVDCVTQNLLVTLKVVVDGAWYFLNEIFYVQIECVIDEKASRFYYWKITAYIIMAFNLYALQTDNFHITDEY